MAYSTILKTAKTSRIIPYSIVASMIMPIDIGLHAIELLDHFRSEEERNPIVLLHIQLYLQLQNTSLVWAYGSTLGEPGDAKCYQCDSFSPIN